MWPVSFDLEVASNESYLRRILKHSSNMASIVIVDRNETAPFVLADAALNDGMDSLPDLVCVGDRIDTDMQEGFLRYESMCSPGAIALTALDAF